MSRGWWNVLWIMLVCWTLACSNSKDSGGTASSGNAGGDDKNNSVPPGPDGGTGTARITDNTGGGEDNPFGKTAPSKTKSPIDAGPARTSLGGSWILVLTQPSQTGFTDFYTGIVNITPGKGGSSWQAEWTAQTAAFGNQIAKLQTFEVATRSAHIVLDLGGTALDFQGQLKSGTVFGNVVFGNAMIGNVLPARLLPTKEESLDGFPPAPDADDFADLAQAFRNEDKKTNREDLKKFLAAHPNSPLSMMAWENIVLRSAELKVPNAEIEKTIADYETALAPWGVRLQQASKANVATMLQQTGYDPDFALKFVTAADSAITDETLSELREQLKTIREGIVTAQALKLIDGDDEQKAAKAAEYLGRIRQKNPFDRTVLYGLARYHQQTKQTNKAIEYFAELASLPQLEMFLNNDLKSDPNSVKETASETLAQLWEKTNGSTDGLDEYKDATYKRRLLAFADKPSADPPAGNRLVLCELFTGSSCPPCVAADVATAGLEFTYPRTQVIVLRYHQHIPAPDPLTNSDGEDRFTNFYRGQGTPSVYINGSTVQNTGGYLFNAPMIYKGLKTLVDQQLKETAHVKVRVAAKIEQDVLKVAADVQGLDQLKDDLDDLRLRVVVAEDEIHFLARNGIRSHEMIARRMIGGPQGTAEKDGVMKISEAIPLADLKAALADYLKNYEDGEGIDFPAKPLDLKRLHIIAFLQNDATHEVLQTNSFALVASDSAAGSEITPATSNAPKTSSKKTKSIE